VVDENGTVLDAAVVDWSVGQGFRGSIPWMTTDWSPGRRLTSTPVVVRHLDVASVLPQRLGYAPVPIGWIS